jgi:hypothetical protein
VHLQPLIELLARGGGGGSGGGGSGGGGIIALLGYLPTHFIGAILRRKLRNLAGLIIMVVATLAYALLWFVIGSYGILVGLAALVGGPAGYFGWFGAISAKLRQKAHTDLAVAARADNAWDPVALEKRVREVFVAFQHDWSVFGVDNMKTYLTAEYGQHMRLVMAAIGLRQRRNVVADPSIIELFPTEVVDAQQDDQDRVSYYINAQADDKLFENINGQENLLFEDNNKFSEYWQFVRSQNTWLLEGIIQTSQATLTPLGNKVKQFAAENGLYYSPDWGWLLLPRRGLLFARGKFGISDINNHAIGLYRNVLVEIYRYTEGANSMDKTYTIAQAALPKRYDSLSVQAKPQGWGRSLLARTPRGYNKLQLEWPDFNKRYIVYATNVEQVTVFELLHPVYMEKLFDLPFKVSIEVVDNVVFLYSDDVKADYQIMFNLLKDAFEEMKL